MRYWKSWTLRYELFSIVFKFLGRSQKKSVRIQPSFLPDHQENRSNNYA